MPIRIELDHPHETVRHHYSKELLKGERPVIDPATKKPTTLRTCQTKLDLNLSEQPCTCGQYVYALKPRATAARDGKRVRLADLPPEDVAALVALVRQQVMDGQAPAVEPDEDVPLGKE